MKTKSKIILGSLLVIALCISLIAGTTFALFTSEDKVDVVVKSAKVDVSADIANGEGDITYGYNGVSGLNESLSAVYANTDAGKVLTISNMTPGDVVMFKVVVKSNASINVKYRLKFGSADENASDTLYSQLLLGVKDSAEESVPYDYYVDCTSDWSQISYSENAAEMTVTKYVAIELPAYVTNAWQEATCNIQFAVEAVQANASEGQYGENGSAVKAYRVSSDAELDQVIGALADNATAAIVLDSASGDYSIESDKALVLTVRGGNVGTLTVNAPNAEIDYYVDYTNIVDVNAVADNSFHVYGTVVEALTVKQGRAVIEENAQVAKAVAAPAANRTAIIIANANLAVLETAGEGVAKVEIAPSVSVSETVENNTNEASSLAKQIADVDALLKAAEEGGSYLLINDLDVSEQIMVSADFTLNGQNHTINSTASRMLRIISSNSKVQLLNVKMLRNGNNAVERSVQIDPNIYDVNLTIDGCELEASYYTVNVCGNAGVNMTIRNSKVTGWGAINCWSNNYEVNVYDSELIGINDKPYNAEGWNGFGTIVVEGDTTNQTEEHASDLTLNFTRCNIVADSTTGNIQKVVLFNSKSRNNIISLNDCTYELKNDSCVFVVDNGTNNKLIVNKDGEKFVGARSANTLGEILMGTEYNDIFLTGNLYVSSSLTLARSIDINLNGFALTCAGAEGFDIINGADVTVTNGSLMFANGTAMQTAKLGKEIAVIGVSGGSTITLDGVTMTTDYGTGILAKGQDTTVNVVNSTIMVGGYYVVGTNNSTVENGGVIINIDGSTLTASITYSSAVFTSVPCDVTINNSTLSGQLNAVYIRAGKASITDSTLNCTAEASFTDYDSKWNASGNGAPASALVVGSNNATKTYGTADVTISGCTLNGGAKKELSLSADLNGAILTVDLTEAEVEAKIADGAWYFTQAANEPAPVINYKTAE